MFARILQWIREWLNKMLDKGSVKSALGVDVATSIYMTNALMLWSEMYVGRAYWLNQGTTSAGVSGEGIRDIRSLNLPASIAGEIARAVTIELKIELSGSSRADWLDEQMELVVPRLREQVEYGCAKGGLMLKPYIKDGGIAVDYVQADQFYPIAFDTNGKITACVFSDQRVVGDKYYTRLEYHTLIPGGYMIKNQAFRSQTLGALGTPCELGEIEDWANLETETTITNIDKPLFGYFRYPTANNIDPTSPLGVSCYSRAVDLIQAADTQWSDLLWEFESGKRALYVDELAFGKDKSGKPRLPNKLLYRTMESGNSEADLFQEWSPTLREQNILNGLDAMLQRIEFVCGLASGTLCPDIRGDTVRTATEIKITRQRTYATVTDTQKALQDALEQLLYAMDIWATVGNLSPAGDYEAVYDFDDSVVTDHDVQLSQDMQVTTAGLMAKYEFRMRNYGETEEIAKQMVAEIQKEQMSVMDLFAPPPAAGGAPGGKGGGTADTANISSIEQQKPQKMLPIRRVIADQ
jgi:A118 family predicted phage portal protein